jgi:WD40 repeat protein
VLAIAPLGGSKIASGSCDKSIIIWSLDPPTELLEVLTGHKSCVNALIPYLKDYIISGSDDGRIILWNWNLQSNVKTIVSFNPALNQTVNALASFNNKYLAAALGDGSIQIFSMNDQDIILVRNISAHSNSVLDVKFLNNGNLASASKDKTIKVWDVNTYKNIFINSNHNSSVLCLAVMPNANLVSGSEDKTIQIFNTNLYSNNTIIY